METIDVRILAISVVAALLLVANHAGEAAKPGGGRGKPGGGGSASGPSFTGVNLGVLPGDIGSTAEGVSESGSVVGSSFFSDGISVTTFSPAYWHFNGQGWDAYALPKGSSNESKDGYASGISGPVGSEEYVVGSIGPAAAIWTVTGHTSFSSPVFLDQEGNCNFSNASAVSASRIAVGMCDNHAAIWAPSQSGYSSTVLSSPASGYTQAMDVNDDGVIVGRDCDESVQHCHAFVLKFGSTTVVQLDDQINGDPDSYAAAVSDVVEVGGQQVVYVTGSTTSTNGVEAGTRWTVPVSVLSASPSGSLTQTRLTGQWCSGVNNAGEAVCTKAGGGRQTTVLLRSGVVSSLKPPKGGTDAAGYDLARTSGLPTYAVGNAQIGAGRAAVWVINK
jgi:hypothetical protein